MQFSMINITLAVFNMIPLPPLDGFRIVKIISLKFAEKIEKYTQYIVMAFLILVLV
jgi:Zn-dependent protease